jgi:2-polyprenyl-6-methoxyphenol hydroxylase-like FAD-dependent oxidoreductase
LGGCATALAMHNAGSSVSVYEKLHKFERLGDSLGLGENALLLLERRSNSLRDRLVEIGNKSQYKQIRRWKDGKMLAQQEMMDMAGLIGYRGDYHEVFLKAVREKNIPVYIGSKCEWDTFKMPSKSKYNLPLALAASEMRRSGIPLWIVDDKTVQVAGLLTNAIC